MTNRCFLCLFLFLLAAFPCLSQVTEQAGNENISFSYDTALVNGYLKRSNSFCSNPVVVDSAMFYLTKARDISAYRHYKKGLAETFRQLSVIYSARYLFDSALWAAEKELYWSGQTGDPKLLLKANASKGIVFEHQGKLDSATQYYIKALHISDSIGDRKASGKINNNLAVLFENIGDFKTSAHYATAGYHVGKAIDDSLVFINCLFNIGSVKYDQEQYDTAMIIFEQVRKIVQHSPAYKLLGVKALINEGNILSDQGKNNRALARYKKVLQSKTGISPYITRYAYYNIGATLEQMKQPDKAEPYFIKAVQIDKKIHSRNELRVDYLSLSQVKEEKKQFASALAYRKKYDSLNDTLMNESVKESIHALEIKYNAAKKDKQIALQNLELSVKQRSIAHRNTWLAIVIGSLLALAVILILSIRSYRHKKKLQEQSVLALRKQHEVNTLMAKMEAREEERNRIGKEMHDDVGSALTTILFLSEDLQSQKNNSGKNIPEKIASTAGMVVDKMNEIIWSMNRDYDTLDDLIAYSRRHAAQFLENHGIAYRFEVPDPIPDIQLHGEQRRNIYLVIREALHNIVKHADASKVAISFYLNHNLTVKIQDDGKGIDTGQLRRFGNGLRNMQQRMQSVGGSLDITADHGTIITLACPLDRAV